MDQGDEEKQRAERDGACQHGFDQQHCPAAQQENMDEQPDDKTERKRNAGYNVKE